MVEKLLHNFVVHSNESACRKSGRLGLNQVYLPREFLLDNLVRHCHLTQAFLLDRSLELILKLKSVWIKKMSKWWEISMNTENKSNYHQIWQKKLNWVVWLAGMTFLAISAYYEYFLYEIKNLYYYCLLELYLLSFLCEKFSNP